MENGGVNAMELKNFVKNHLEKEIKQNNAKPKTLAKEEPQAAEVRFEHWILLT